MRFQGPFSHQPEEGAVAARAGVELSTTEALIFELVDRCDHPRFKEILRLVK